MEKRLLAILVAFLALVQACQSPPATNPPTSAPSIEAFPDLLITGIFVEMQGRTQACVESYTPYEIRVVVQNAGDAPTPPFQVALNHQQQAISQGLPAGQRILLHFALSASNGHYIAIADPDNQVREREENNNQAEYQAVTPTPPPRCTGAPDPTATPLP